MKVVKAVYPNVAEPKTVALLADHEDEKWAIREAFIKALFNDHPIPVKFIVTHSDPGRTSEIRTDEYTVSQPPTITTRN